jgi:hypothetical protein
LLFIQFPVFFTEMLLEFFPVDGHAVKITTSCELRNYYSCELTANSLNGSQEEAIVNNIRVNTYVFTQD